MPRAPLDAVCAALGTCWKTRSGSPASKERFLLLVAKCLHRVKTESLQAGGNTARAGSVRRLRARPFRMHRFQHQSELGPISKSTGLKAKGSSLRAAPAGFVGRDHFTRESEQECDSRCFKNNSRSSGSFFTIAAGLASQRLDRFLAVLNGSISMSHRQNELWLAYGGARAFQKRVRTRRAGLRTG